MDAANLREFYASRFGNATRKLIADKLNGKFGVLDGLTLMALGFAIPYLDSATASALRRLVFMQARQGVVEWPAEGPIQSALVDEFDLPLLESTVDIALVVHSLELTDSPEDLLNEVWRVLVPQGRVILVVPNRRGLWASFDTSPFGYGQPFSRPQVAALLSATQFSLASCTPALFMPPVGRSLVLSSAALWERAGALLRVGLAGVLIVEAVKQVYAVSPGRRARRALPRLRPMLAPSPARRG